MTLVINCDQCTMQHTTQCQDCVVSFLCEEAGVGVIIDAAEERAVRMLGQVGLVPALRHQPRRTCA